MTILVVAAGTPDAIEAALPEAEWQRVDSPSAVRTSLAEDPPEVVVVDGSSLENAATEVVDAVRAVDGTVPVVVVAETGVEVGLRSIDDLVLAPFEDDVLWEAVQRARLVSRYDDAVSALFEQCRRRAEDEPGTLEIPPDLRRLRQDADDLLDDLVALEAPDLLAAILEAAEDGAGSAGGGSVGDDSDADE